MSQNQDLTDKVLCIKGTLRAQMLLIKDLMALSSPAKQPTLQAANSHVENAISQLNTVLELENQTPTQGSFQMSQEALNQNIIYIKAALREHKCLIENLATLFNLTDEQIHCLQDALSHIQDAVFYLEEVSNQCQTK